MPWMTDLFRTANDARGPFPDRPLSRVTLPGTHDSGCYVDRAVSNALSKTQSQDIYGQLLGGIRYFDIRPCVKDGRLFTYHGEFYTGGPIDGEDGILMQLRRFMLELETAHRELVILNISHFYHFTHLSHELLIQQIVATLGEFLVPHRQGGINLFQAPYRTLLDDGKGAADSIRSRVAVLYDGALDTAREEYVASRGHALPKGFFVVAPKYPMGENSLYLFDQYSNSTGVDDGVLFNGMQTDQLLKLTQRNGYGFAPNGKWTVPEGYDANWFLNQARGVPRTLHLLSWTLTPQKVLGDPLEYARRYANPRLLAFFTEHGRWVGQDYDPLADPQVNIVYVDDYASLLHTNIASPWFGLAMPVAISARLNAGALGAANTW
ncbi:hypothetical protein LQR31_02475 [Chromobacterium vaccinii]|uniref:hypothetical protein n=1 Tax=Chromobacterium vaccinii TaxID=1108595 RepID=UPI001E462BF2|nr:hypothetical protein [Chromobacterium vaccinii]MCD4483338.1 hypothetical protein [Chromobacterium vaccinii]